MTRTRRTLHVATGVVLWTMASQAFAQTTTNDLIFIIDRSGSIQPEEWDLEVNGLLECICGTDSIIPQGSIDEYKVTVITFAGQFDAAVAANLDGVVINLTTRPQVCDAINDLFDLNTQPGRSGFARRSFVRSADVGPSPTYPAGETPLPDT